MEFRARLNRISHIYRDWQGGGKPQGVLAGVVFRWAQGGEYLTGTLKPDDVEKLRHLPHVTIEATAMTMPRSAGITPTQELIAAPAPVTPPPDDFNTAVAKETLQGSPYAKSHSFQGLSLAPPLRPPVSLEQTLRPMTRQPHKHKGHRR